MPIEYSEDELKEQILAKLWGRKLFGGRHQPKEEVMGSIPKRLRSVARNLMDELRREGLLIYRKGGKCVSLNPRSKERLKSILEEVLPDYYL